MDKLFDKKEIKDLGLLNALEGEERIYIQNEESELEDVNIPLEYFTESKLIEDAIKNLIRRYAKDSYIASKPIEVLGFRVERDSNEKPYLVFECLEQCEEKIPGESYIEYKEKLRLYEKKKMKGVIKPYKVAITESFVDEKCLKIKAENFVGEIDKLLDEKISKESQKINIQLKQHQITREEWLKEMESLRKNTPVSALEYMKEKMSEFEKYYEYITNFPEYRAMFEEESMVVTIAQEATGARSKRLPSDRLPMDHDTVPFEERDQFIRKFLVENVIKIFDEGKMGEVAYKGYVIDNGKEEGKIIVLEPIDGKRTTFVTFSSDDDIKKQRSILEEEQGKKIPRVAVYRKIIASVLEKGWSEKVNDKKIINKYHVESYERDMQFIITGELERGSKVQHSVRTKRAAMIK